MGSRAAGGTFEFVAQSQYLDVELDRILEKNFRGPGGLVRESDPACRSLVLLTEWLGNFRGLLDDALLPDVSFNSANCQETNL